VRSVSKNLGIMSPLLYIYMYFQCISKWRARISSTCKCVCACVAQEKQCRRGIFSSQKETTHRFHTHTHVEEQPICCAQFSADADHQ
jgi:hypothetical protein